MPKLHRVCDDAYAFQCPGCECSHQVRVARTKQDARVAWSWNGSEESPTFAPSILVHPHERYEEPPQPRCHSFVREGMIQFLQDSTHALAGKTVELPEW